MKVGILKYIEYLMILIVIVFSYFVSIKLTSFSILKFSFILFILISIAVFIINLINFRLRKWQLLLYIISIIIMNFTMLNIISFFLKLENIRLLSIFISSLIIIYFIIHAIVLKRNGPISWDRTLIVLLPFLFLLIIQIF